MALAEGAEAVAGATVLTPLETLLTQMVTLTIDGGKAKRYPFTWCDQSAATPASALPSRNWTS